MPKNGPELALFVRLKETLGFYKHQEPRYTLRNLAQYCRVSERTVHHWLKGKTRPKEAKMRLIQEWLESRPKARGFEE